MNVLHVRLHYPKLNHPCPEKVFSAITMQVLEMIQYRNDGHYRHFDSINNKSNKYG